MPWVDGTIKTMIYARDKLANKLKNSRNEDLIGQHTLLKKQVKSRIRAQAKKYGADKLREGDHKGIWKYIRNITFSQKKNNSLAVKEELLNETFAIITYDEEAALPMIEMSCDNQDSFHFRPLAEYEVFRRLATTKVSTAGGHDGWTGSLVKMLSSYIAPNITKIFNLSIETGCFPDCWKLANVKPIYKQKGSKEDANNYRPVSLLPIFARIFEKAIGDQLSGYCLTRNIIPKQQHGFRKFGSCETALIEMTDSWFKAIDEGQIVGALMLDLSKAFDSTPHHLIIQ